ncbi:MAG: hypothetical protein EOR57_14845 [Mesorhizobium sp.]|uniref:hypothetical protein n=1 Tax=Mesorhizobium sp. TaxID=1871066 RepID=UPI000FE7B2EA|nr:hypothetical protein [Mesorhizobium sp.]RWL19347.1 MAG: hypothetical protein EOR57_14845 [Mesorhizobium sp.]
MDDFADKQEKWKDYFLPRAESGDPDAQRAVGLEFSAGRYLPKDLGQSEFWLRKASEKLGERPLFQWMKILVRERDPRVDALFAEKSDWSLAAIYYLYGFYLASEGKIKDAETVCERGMNKGNLFAEALYYRYKYRWPMKVIVIPRIINTAIKSFLVAQANKDDDRVLR